MNLLDNLQTSTGSKLNLPPLGQNDLQSYFSTLASFPECRAEDIDKAVEGLAFASISADIKERLVSPNYLSQLVKLGQSDTIPTYGFLMVLVNVTTFKRHRTAEEKQVDQLREFAKQKLPESNDPFDQDEHVSARVKKLCDAGIVPVVVTLALKISKAQAIIANMDAERVSELPSDQRRSFSVRVCHLLTTLLLNLASVQALHGKLVAGGVVKALLNLLKLAPAKGELETVTEDEDRLLLSKNKTAAQALAKICITQNPRLAFPQERYISLVAPIFQYLLHDAHELLQFEGLLALTNIASLEDQAGYDGRRKILQQPDGIGVIENLLFSENDMVRRAAMETICNLLQDSQVFERYSSFGLPKEIPGPFVANDTCKLKLLVAFSQDSGSFELCRAASGALAILSSEPKVARALVYGSSTVFEDAEGTQQTLKKWAEVILHLLEANNPELVHRGLECVSNMIKASSPTELVSQAPNLKRAMEASSAYLAKSTSDEYVASVHGQLLGLLNGSLQNA